MLKKILFGLSILSFSKFSFASFEVKCDLNLLNGDYKSFYKTEWEINKFKSHPKFLHQTLFKEDIVNGNTYVYKADIFLNPKKPDYLYFKTNLTLNVKNVKDRLEEKKYTITDEIKFNQNKIYSNGSSFLTLKCFKKINNKIIK